MSLIVTECGCTAEVDDRREVRAYVELCALHKAAAPLTLDELSEFKAIAARIREGDEAGLTSTEIERLIGEVLSLRARLQIHHAEGRHECDRCESTPSPSSKPSP